MFARRWMERVRDILSAIAEIGDFTRGMSHEQFRLDPKTIRAVELNFIIIGEAANHVPDDVQARHPDVPWRLIKRCAIGWCMSILMLTRKSCGRR